MANNFNEFMDEFNVHTSASNSNPHKVSSKQIYGCQRLKNFVLENECYYF